MRIRASREGNSGEEQAWAGLLCRDPTSSAGHHSSSSALSDPSSTTPYSSSSTSAIQLFLFSTLDISLPINNLLSYFVLSSAFWPAAAQCGAAMPTPSHATISTPQPQNLPHELSSRPSCPPEDIRNYDRRIVVGRAPEEGDGAHPIQDGANHQSGEINPVTTPSAAQESRQELQNGGDESSPDHSLRSPLKRTDSDEEGLIVDTPSPASTTEDVVESDQRMSQSAHSQTHPPPETFLLLNSPSTSQRVRISGCSSFGLPCVWADLSARYSFYPTRPHLFCALVAAFGVRNNQIAKYTMFKSILSTLIWTNPFYAVTCEYRVRAARKAHHYMGKVKSLHSVAFIFRTRSYRRSSYPYYLFRGGDCWNKVYFPDSTSRMGFKRESRHAALGALPCLASTGQASEASWLQLQEFCAAREHLHALEGILSRAGSSCVDDLGSELWGLLLYLL